MDRIEEIIDNEIKKILPIIENDLGAALLRRSKKYIITTN
jgi:hypothetical protein